MATTCAKCHKTGPVADDQTDPAGDELTLDSRGLVSRNEYVCGACLKIAEAGVAVGRAIARDVLADGLPREWAGLDPQDGDRLTAAGVDPGTPEWAAAEDAAEAAYREAVRS